MIKGLLMASGHRINFVAIKSEQGRADILGSTWQPSTAFPLPSLALDRADRRLQPLRPLTQRGWRPLGPERLLAFWPLTFRRHSTQSVQNSCSQNWVLLASMAVPLSGLGTTCREVGRQSSGSLQPRTSLDGVFIDKFIEIDKFDFYRIYR
jgi:hypothetical protein